MSLFRQLKQTEIEKMIIADMRCHAVVPICNPLLTKSSALTKSIPHIERLLYKQVTNLAQVARRGQTCARRGF